MQSRLIIASLFAITAVAMVALSGSATSPKNSTPQNVDVSQRLGNESEEAIAVNPTNPNNIVIFTNIAEGVNGVPFGEERGRKGCAEAFGRPFQGARFCV